jgi:hypothetical protein
MQKKDELLSLIYSYKNVSILSQGGTGKSTLITAVKQQLNDSLSFHITSTTGVSAYLIKGSTIHSYSGIGVIMMFDKEINPNGHEIIEGVKLDEMIGRIEKLFDILCIKEYHIMSEEKLKEYNDYVDTTIKVI